MLITFLGFSKQLEVLILILIGICYLAFDPSLFHVKKDLEEIWDYRFAPRFQKYSVDLYLKYILSGVVFVRAFTLHLFLASYIVMLWPAVFRDRPHLMLPWLVLGSIRSILVTIVTLATGSYVCIIQKGNHLICWDFILAQIIDNGPSLYVWCTILLYYKDLMNHSIERQRRKSILSDAAYRRKRTKSICLRSPLHKVIIPSFIKTRSSETMLESFLQELAEESSDGMSTPRSRSLDSLLKEKLEDEPFLNELFEDEDLKTVTEKVMALFNLTEEEILNLRKEKNKRNIDQNEHMEDKLMRSLYYQGIDIEDVTAGAAGGSRSINNLCANVSSRATSGKNIRDNKKCECSVKEIEFSEIHLKTTSYEKFQQSEDSDVIKEFKASTCDHIKLCTKRVVLGNDEEIFFSRNKESRHIGCQANSLSKLFLELAPALLTTKFVLGDK